MKIIFGLLFGLIFLYINFRIIRKDYTHKIIPNRLLTYLLALIPAWYMYAEYYEYVGNFTPSIFVLQICVTLIICFALYSFNIWGAGDAKYLCVLGLFIPHIGIIPFIGNIAFITLLYLVIYFLWFWFGKFLWNKERRIGFFQTLWRIKKEDFLSKNNGLNKRELLFKFLIWLNMFLVFFLSIRFLRIFIFSYIGSHYNIPLLLQKYGMYIFLGGFLIIFCISLIIKIIIWISKKYIFKKAVHMVYAVSCVSFIGIGLLLYGYGKNPSFFTQEIIIIFTVYLTLYFLIRFLWASCKTAFKMQEQEILQVDNLKVGTIIDKKWFDEILERDRDIFGNIEISGKVLSEEDVHIVKKVIHDVKKRDGLEHIPTYKTFGFAIFILTGFFITLINHSFFIMLLIKAYQIFFS